MPLRRAILPAVLVSSLALLAVHSAGGGEVALERFDGGVRVTIDGKPFTEYLTLSGSKPILWPILGPHGHQMTRNYPMKQVWFFVW